VRFSNRGKKQFAPHRIKAEEHLAETFLHLMGKVSSNMEKGEDVGSNDLE
jgi:hypothetical protein